MGTSSLSTKQFSSIDDVVGFLLDHKLNKDVGFLLKSIDQEARDLCTINDDTFEGNLDSAREHFLDEINKFILEPDLESMADVIINYRRRPKTWAIASKIQQTGDLNGGT